MIGKINTLDLNDAQVNKDEEARQKNISELFYYWYYYYQLRSLTLWDFAQNKGIDADFDDIIKKIKAKFDGWLHILKIICNKRQIIFHI